MTNVEKLLSDLIALPSVNPAFLPPRDACAGERRVAEFLAARAARAGFDSEFQPALPGRANLVVRLQPRGKTTHRFLLAPHLDTVGGAPPLARFFQPRRSSGRIYGRGACDTKGSVAAMFQAVLDVAARSSRPQHTEILFAGLVDEEHGQAGSRALAATGIKVDLAVVGEPTRLKIVTAHKGVLWLELTTRGKAAHGARPELGRNAVHAMARVVEALERDYAALLRRRRHALLGRPTVNVGAIHGGSQPNIVPMECAISVDRRTLPGETHPEVIREIRRFLKQHGHAVQMRPVRLGPSQAMETDPQLPWVRQMSRQAGQRHPVGVDYFSDAGVLAAAGIPSVLFGPGDIAQAHTPDEWIDTAQLKRARDFLAAFLLSLP